MRCVVCVSVAHTHHSSSTPCTRYMRDKVCVQRNMSYKSTCISTISFLIHISQMTNTLTDSSPDATHRFAMFPGACVHQDSLTHITAEQTLASFNVYSVPDIGPAVQTCLSLATDGQVNVLVTIFLASSPVYHIKCLHHQGCSQHNCSDFAHCQPPEFHSEYSGDYRYITIWQVNVCDPGQYMNALEQCEPCPLGTFTHSPP